MGKIGNTKMSGLIPFLGGGINEYDSPIALADTEFQQLDDCFLKDSYLWKRPGRVLDSNYGFTGTFRGVVDYIDNDGYSRLIVANDGKVLELSEGEKFEIDTISDEDIHFTTVRGRLYYNGVTTQRKINRTIAYDVGLVGPAVAPTAALNGSGSQTGSYAWVYTFAFTDADGTEFESNPSPVSSSLNMVANKATVTIAISSDSRVSKRKIYRSVAGGSVYLYEGEIANNSGTSFASTIIDAALELPVERTHGKPTAGTISEGAADRLFWAVGRRVYFSEKAQTDAYLEYSGAGYFTLPGAGACTVLKKVYNVNSGSDDLYCFQGNTISVLPGADPMGKIYSLSLLTGCEQQDTVCVYGDTIVFLNNYGRVCVVSGGILYDISSRNIPTSLNGITDKTKCRGSIIYQHYYALCAPTDFSKLYNNAVFVCDLQTIAEVGKNIAKAQWVKWNIDAEYIYQTSDNVVLVFDNNSKSIWTLSVENSTDFNGFEYSNIPYRIVTKSFSGETAFFLKQPRQISLKGFFGLPITVTPIYWIDNTGGSSTTMQAKTLFIMGESLMGDLISAPDVMSEAQLEQAAGCNSFGFMFSSDSIDEIFRLHSFQFTFREFKRGF